MSPVGGGFRGWTSLFPLSRGIFLGSKFYLTKPMSNNSAIQQFNNSAIQQFNNSAIQQFNNSTIQQFNNKN
jgi:hypothetical protein